MPGASATAAKALILALPGVEEGMAYDGLAYRLRGRLFAGFLQDATVHARHTSQKQLRSREDCGCADTRSPPTSTP